MRYTRLPGWTQCPKLASQERRIHTLRQLDLYTHQSSDRQANDLAISLSVNIHDRKSNINTFEYSQNCIKTDLPGLVRAFQIPRKKIRLCMLLAESTLFFKNPDSGKIKTRGGHIVACELVIPATSDPTPIIIDKIISKLPGGSPINKSTARTVSGRLLEGQDYEVTAKYETSDNVLLFRDSNSPIDLNYDFSAPVFIALVNPSKVDFDYHKMYENAVEIAARDKVYKRMGGACGEFIVESYQGELSHYHRTGMATQAALNILLADIAAKSAIPDFRDTVYQAVREIRINLDPSSMYDYGINLAKQYRKTLSGTNAKTLKNSDECDNLDGGKVNQTSVTGGGKS